MMINANSQLEEKRERSFPDQPLALKIAAQIVSYIFHPVFVPLYVIYFLAYVHPYLFAGFDPRVKFQSVMMSSFVIFTMFPMVTVFLLKGLKFIDSVYLRTQKERIIPILACMIWYFWIWYVWSNFGKTNYQVDMPKEAVQFAFGTFVSTIISLMVNIRMKVSLHAISAGMVLMLFILMAFSQPLNYGLWLSIVFLLTGMVCTARFIVSDHTAAEVYVGLLVGIVSMMIGASIF